MTNIFGFNVDHAINAMGDKFNQFVGGNPFGASGMNGGNPFGATGVQGGNAFGATGPQGGNAFGATGPQGGNAFGATGPTGGNPFQVLSAAPVSSVQPVKVPASTSTPPGGGPSAGMTPGVAKWAAQTQQVFGDIAGLDPDTMLAIMTNESGGDPNVQNHEGFPAYGLFQLWNQPGLNADQQFQAAHTLAQQKMTDLQKSYAANGLNPDARTRARDFALAWAGQFDYKTGQPNPNSHDAGSNQQSAADLTAVFLKNYDAIKGGRTQGGNIGGGTGGLPGITPGVQGSVMQEFGDTDYSRAHPSTYAYASAYGASGHTGVDWAVPRGTKVAAPVSGTVTLAGGNDGSGYFFTNTTGGADADHSGELRITLDNGDQLILGHMSDLTNVHVGQRVNPGDFVGLSGGSDGDHIHVEVRVKDSSVPSGYRIIDPRTYLR